MQTRAPSRSVARQVEWRTLALLGANYLAWLALLWLYPLSPVAVVVLLGLCLTLHLSLQHECIHGHPTTSTRLNDLLGLPPLALVYPYGVYKETHLRHHRDEFITMPGIDPESYFYTATEWRSMTTLGRALAWANMTLLGRLLLNPLRGSLAMCWLGWRQLRHGNARQRLTWITHVAGITLVLWVVTTVFLVPAWAYLLGAYLAHALISLRAFFEHRMTDSPEERIVVVESCGLFRFLFLNNNFHAVHHRHPGLPWYRIAPLYRAEQRSILERNGEFHFKGYGDWLRYLVRPVAAPVHPALLPAP